MGLDIKIPIGLMFSLFGIMLVVYGLATNSGNVYAISLGINVNLWSGLFMAVFGGFMLFTSTLMKSKKKE